MGFRKSTAAVVHVQSALAAVPVRHEEIRESVAREIGRSDRGGRVPGQHPALGKRAGSVIDADVVRAPVLRAAAIRNDDLGPPVAVQVRHRDVPRRPVGLAEGPREHEGRRPVVPVEALVVGPVVPDHQVEIAVPVEVGERRGVGVVRRTGEFAPFPEAARPVVQQDPVLQRPVPALREHDVQIAVAVEIPEARVGAGLGGVFEGHRSHFLRVGAGHRQQQSAEARPDHVDTSVRYSPRRFGPMSTSVT